MNDSVNAIIGAFQGVSELGRAIGATPQAVSNMRARGSIPPRYWPRLVEAAKARGIAGVTFETLSAIAVDKSASPSNRAGNGGGT